jgi:hypothetical protein
MYIGISARYKDKRVDKTLSKLGFTEYEIFYSPLIVSLTYLLMLLAVSAGMFFPVLFSLGYSFIVCTILICYFLLYYMIAAYSNNSFAITSDALVIINPNYPFRNHTVIPLKNITDIHIGSHTPVWRKIMLFLSPETMPT